MIYVVLGMHKSGTTLVARLLHESGVSMGEFDERLGYGEGNRYERHDAQQANRDLLHGCQIPPLDYLIKRPFRDPVDAAGYTINRDSQAFVRYRSLAKRLDRPEAANRIRAVIERCRERHADWGFKDPRTCLTFPAWRKNLPAHRIVVVYRGLDQILERSGANAGHPMRAARVIHAWSVYNWSILKHLEVGGAPRIVLRYEQLMEGDAGLEKLSAFAGRPLEDARRSRLYRTRQAPPLPAWTRGLSSFLPMPPAEIEARLGRLAA